MARRALFALSIATLTGCSTNTPVAERASVTPAVVTDPTTTTTTEPPPTTTTTEPEPPPAPVTTTVHVHPPTTAAQAPRTTLAPAPARSTSGSGACGGDLPPCHVVDRESGGDPAAIGYGQCGTENCYGKWQIHPDTAEAYGYPRRMDLQPESVQDQAARDIYAADGCDAWSTC